jgi:hypothetical protein
LEHHFEMLLDKKVFFNGDRRGVIDRVLYTRNPPGPSASSKR